MKRTVLVASLLLVISCVTPLTQVALAQQPKIIRAGLPDAIASPLGQSMIEFKRIVEAKTGKSIEVQLFPANQLGTIVEQIANVKQGSQEMMVSTPGMFSRFYSKMDMLEMPFLLADWDKAERLFSSAIFKRLIAEAEKQATIRIIGAFPQGFRNILSRKGSISSLSDLKGLKIRLQESAVHLATFRALGASPITLPISDVYQALQTGVVDAAENSNSILLANKFDEVAKYLTETRHFFNVMLCYINPAFYNGLTDDQRATVDGAIRSAEVFTWKNAKEVEVKAAEEMARHSVKVTYASPTLHADLVRETRSIYNEYGKRFQPDLGELQQMLSRP